MSIEFVENHPQNKLKFAYKVTGKRVVVRISDELYEDEYLHMPESILKNAIQDALTLNRDNILNDFKENNNDGNSPSYVLTTHGLVKS